MDDKFYAVWHNKYLRQHIYAQIRGTDARIAAKYGNLEAFKYSILEYNDYDGGLSLAAYKGHLDIVKWFHENKRDRYISFYEWTMIDAATTGHLDIVRFLHENNEGCEKPVKTMDYAVMNGKLNVLQFLHQNNYNTCTSDAIYRASRQGHLNVLQFLHEHNYSLQSDGAIEAATINGHLDVIKFLLENSNNKITRRIVKIAAETGRLETLKWLYYNYPVEYNECDLEKLVYMFPTNVKGWVEAQKWRKDNCIASVFAGLSIAILVSQAIFLFGKMV